jgi:hypothetical protein
MNKKGKSKSDGRAQNLPIAPEFVEILQEQVGETLLDCLDKLKAPSELIDLVNDLWGLGYYLQMRYQNPGCLSGENQSFDGAGAVIASLNHLAAVGAVFHSGYSYSLPRPGTLLAPLAPHQLPPNSESANLGGGPQ